MVTLLCCMDLGGLGIARQFLRQKHCKLSPRGHLVGGNKWYCDPMPAMTWIRGNGTAELASYATSNPSFPDAQPPLEVDTAVYADKFEEERVTVTPEKLNQWMRESIGEIVRNIGEAPFLVRIFSDGDGVACVRVEREAASPERWPQIKKRWREGRPTPDAVILVEEIEEEEAAAAAIKGIVVPRTTWGMVVQGRGMDCVACYILKTTRVKSSVGFCTHFCLIRAKCFGETAEVQLTNAWLQRR